MSSGGSRSAGCISRKSVDLVAQFFINSLIAGSIYALLAVSFNFMFAATRFFNLAHGSIVVIGAYGLYYFGRELEWSLWLAIPLAVAIAALVGFAVERLVYHPLRARGGSPMILLVASLGVMTVIHSILAIIFTSNFTTVLDPFEKTLFSFFNAHFTSVQLTIFLTSLVVSVLFFILMKKTLFGKVVAAVSDDEEVSQIVGINTNNVMAQVFLVGSAIAGLGGVLAGIDTGVSPSMDMVFLLKAVIAAIVGGVGSIYGGFLGAFLIGFAENFGILVIPSQWKDMIAFAILIVFMLVRPQGILGKK